jgi:hypothetical protein
MFFGESAGNVHFVDMDYVVNHGMPEKLMMQLTSPAALSRVAGCPEKPGGFLS